MPPKAKNKAKNAGKQSEKHSKRDTKGALTFGLIYGTFWAQAQKLQQIVVAHFVVAVVAHATARPHTAETRVSINQLFAAAQGIGKRAREREGEQRCLQSREEREERRVQREGGECSAQRGEGVLCRAPKSIQTENDQFCHLIKAAKSSAIATHRLQSAEQNDHRTTNTHTQQLPFSHRGDGGERGDLYNSLSPHAKLMSFSRTTFFLLD